MMDKRLNIYIKIALAAIILSCTMPVSLLGSGFDIHRFSDPFKYNWPNEETRLRFRDNLFMQTVMLDEYEEQKQAPLTNALKTAIAPGWGHFSVNSYTKGQVFLGVQVVLLGTGLYYREKAMIEYRKYENATQIEDINRYYDDAMIPHRQSTLLLSLFAIMWGYTIYDSILETNNYNWNLWESISGSIDSNLTITPTSITYRF